MVNDPAKPSHLEGADAAQLKEFLASAPEALRGWADEQLAGFEPEPASSGAPDSPTDQAVGVEAFADFSDDEPLLRRPAASGQAPTNSVGGVNKVNLILVALLAAAVVIIVQQWGRSTPPETSAAPQTTAASAMPGNNTEFPPLDEAKAAELKQQIEADPTNVESLRELGKLYFDSGLYQDAVVQFDRALELAPDDVEVLLSAGVAQYSLNNYAVAEKHWLRATEVDPTLAEPWYNLGFLYLAQTPPDYAGVERAWGKVIEVAPDSELAQTAAAHLERFRASSSSATPGG